MASITGFFKEYRYLSNFHIANIFYEGIEYPSSEHAYQAAKSLDIEVRKFIATLDSPMKAQKAGQQIECRPRWEEIKIGIMYNILLEKFTRHPELALKLLDTNDCVLVEGNTWDDTFWGVCNGEGTNWLGKTLMRIRKNLRTILEELCK